MLDEVWVYCVYVDVVLVVVLFELFDVVCELVVLGCYYEE